MSNQSTTLLDCSHEQSSEFIAGHRDTNSLYTNRLGSGIKVETGDSVTVHQSFISEVGSDDNSLQIPNKLLEQRDITYTKITSHIPVNGSNNRIMGYERQSASNITEEMEVFNNKTALLYGYYITNHGENTYGLPRRFVYKSESSEVDWNASIDTEALGRSYGNPALITSVDSIFNGSKLSMFHCDDDYFWLAFGNTNGSASNILKPRIDNSRFKIFIQRDTRYGLSSETLTPLINGSLTSPALLDYIEYIEKLDIEIPAGFKSPDSIANIITNTLRSQSQPEVQKLSSLAPYVAIQREEFKSANLEINSPTYHTFYAGSQYTLNETNYKKWEADTTDSDNGLKYLSGYQYIGIKRPELWLKGREFNNYYKDLLNSRVAGTAPNVSFANSGLSFDLPITDFYRSVAPSDTSRRHTIVTPELWSNKTYMNKLKSIFDEQGRHPELFENKYNQYNGFTKESNSRFLHLNAMNDVERTKIKSTLGKQLGTDHLQSYEQGVPYLDSMPIFFDYNPEYKDIYSEGESWDTGYSYGVFYKYKDVGGTNLEYIAFTTSHLGFLEDTSLNASFSTIPNLAFRLNNNDITDTGTIDEDTRFGWDANFTSYGNVCFGTLAGWSLNTFDKNSFTYQTPTEYSTTQLQTHLYQQKLYMGANEPLLEYNTISNKFEISKLHTSERVQNRQSAGSEETINGVKSLVEEFTTAGDKVYKINKRIYNNTYTPNMIPYRANNINNLPVQTTNTRYNIDFLNPNFTPWTIFDQLSGIVISDFGYSEKNWLSGLWGILGFDYSQFNSQLNSDNDLTSRVGNGNKNNLPYAFTNANVDQLTTMDLPTNVFGAGIYNLQLPSTMAFNVINDAGLNNQYFRFGVRLEQFVAITKPAESVKLEAPRLPRKLKNPYFCVRSDILDDSQYIGGADSGQLFPVIATIPKSNDYGDYFVGLDSSISFTFTKPKTITSITTSIHNPDQSLANIDSSSSIIYKITKNLNPNRFNILDQILNDKK